jgi:small subunit ribosomal protein S10e
MIISKENRKIIYENLFKEGVLVAKKDFNAEKHLELAVPNRSPLHPVPGYRG